MSVAQSEELIKEQLLTTKLTAMAQGNVTIPGTELKENYLKQNRKVKFAYAVLSSEGVRKQVKVTDSELKAFYDKHKQEYVNSIAEKRKARYLAISASNIPGVNVSDDDIKQYYNQHADQYKLPERVQVRHILVKTPTPAAD